MVTAADARAAATRSIHNDLPGTVVDVELVGMTTTPEGQRVGYEVEWDRGPDIGEAIRLGVIYGASGTFLAVAAALLLVLVGVGPSGILLAGLVFVGGGVYFGATAGYAATEREHVTVTVDDAGTVVMLNRDLSSGEFHRALDRQYDRQTAQFDGAVSHVSKHWLVHKIVDRLLDRGRQN